MQSYGIQNNSLTTIATADQSENKQTKNKQPKYKQEKYKQINYKRRTLPQKKMCCSCCMVGVGIVSGLIGLISGVMLGVGFYEPINGFVEKITQK